MEFGPIRRVCIRFVAFGHQGAEILSAEGRKFYVLAVFRGNSAAFCLKVVLNVGIFLTKLGRNGVWVRPDGMSLTFLDFVTRGLRNKARKVKKWAFGLFAGEFDSTKWTKRGKKASKGD